MHNNCSFCVENIFIHSTLYYLKMNDSETILCIKNGGVSRQHALSMIYKRSSNKERIIRVLIKMGMDEEEANDIFHDGIITLDHSICAGKFRGESSIDTYLYSICKFLCLNQWRKKRKMLYIEDITIIPGALENISSNSLLDDFIRAEEKTIIDKLLHEVGEICQKVLKLWQLNYSMEEISSIIGLSSPQMAKKKRFMCHKKLMLLIHNRAYYSSLYELAPSAS